MYLVWHFSEDMSLPTINFIHNDLTLKCVLAKLGQDNCPDNPVNTTSSDNTKTNNAVKVVRQSLIDAVSVARWDEWGNDKVDVAEEEKDGDRKRGFHWRIPVVLLLVEVDPYETGSDEGVHDSKRVRNNTGSD